jgi:hypothetical protein
MVVGGKPRRLALSGSDIKAKLRAMPTNGGSACFDFSKGGVGVLVRWLGDDTRHDS